MSLLKSLEAKTAHPCRSVFKKFKNANVARLLGIQPDYFSSIMNGSKNPGKELDRKIFALADQVQAELNKEVQS